MTDTLVDLAHGASHLAYDAAVVAAVAGLVVYACVVVAAWWRRVHRLPPPDLRVALDVMARWFPRDDDKDGIR